MKDNDACIGHTPERLEKDRRTERGGGGTNTKVLVEGSLCTEEKKRERVCTVGVEADEEEKKRGRPGQ